MSQADTPYGIAVPGDSGTPRSLARVLADVAAERAAQDRLWGIQDFPNGTGHEHAAAAEAAKHDCDTAWTGARLTWRHLLAEEFCEALAETDLHALRTELVQTAAVAVKWVQALDRRDGHLTHHTKPGSGRREKLVRDRVPDLIRSTGRQPDVRVANDGEYAMLLRAKLYEEVGEFAGSGKPAELADIMEVVHALAAAQGLGPDDLRRLRASKAARSGGFQQRYVLCQADTPTQAPPRPLTRRSVRAILLDGNDLILYKRTMPGQQPYWTTPGGRVELDDLSLKAALRRELHEELGATVTEPRQVFTLTEQAPGVDYVHTFYACRLESMDLTKRSGPEFTDPAKGRYDVDRIPLTRAAIDAIPLRPDALASYLSAHATDISTLLPPAPRSPDRYRSIVDVMMILIRDGRVLLAERQHTGYADGQYNLPSGHLEDGESVVEGVIRETREEIGIDLNAADLRCVHVMHYRSPKGQGRIGMFFHADRWQGEPENREPHKCAGIGWFPLDQLPANTVPYTQAGLDQLTQSISFSVQGWPQSDET